ncbi:MAG: glutamine-hydrolyzing GMP synthase [Patescibacteria group bacterium]
MKGQVQKYGHPPGRSRSIVILDFGGQYAHLIGSRVRRLGAFSEILTPETQAKNLKHAEGIILSGGPQSVYDQGSPQADPAILALGIPILGICYGHQWLAHALNGQVKPGKTKEYGRMKINIRSEGKLFQGLPEEILVWMSHGDSVETLPEGFDLLAVSADGATAAMEDIKRKFFGVQFHLEVAHTEHGLEILKRFVDLCKPASWSIESYAKRIGDEVRRDVGDKKVFMLVSGGVDSTVAFTLFNTVLGVDRVQGLLVDTGLMRNNEVRDINTAFDRLGIKNLRIEDASREFFTALEDVYEPEEKRRAIGNTFLAVQKRVFEEMGLASQPANRQTGKLANNEWLLGQGTIYPDTIETGGTKHADQIKTHHKRVEAVQKMIDKGLVIEPLKDLYKDEVRKLGEELGLPHELVWRHPFPGPGLGVRILCALPAPPNPPLPRTGEGDTGGRGRGGDIAIHSKFASVVLPIKSVGVQGDGRTYRHAVSLFGSLDEIEREGIWRAATEIPNRNPEINRVLFCLSHTEPQQFEVTPSFITRARADLLREADKIVHNAMVERGWYEKIWQFPVVLLPMGIGSGKPASAAAPVGRQSIVLRPINSTEAMTADATKLDRDFLCFVTKQLLRLPGIDSIFYDLTSKPPGTIEWE